MIFFDNLAHLSVGNFLEAGGILHHPHLADAVAAVGGGAVGVTHVVCRVVRIGDGVEAVEGVVVLYGFVLRSQFPGCVREHVP